MNKIERDEEENIEPEGYEPESNEDISCPYCGCIGSDCEGDVMAHGDDWKGYYIYRCEDCGQIFHVHYETIITWVE